MRPPAKTRSASIRREDARAVGLPEPRPNRCPACNARKVTFIPAGHVVALGVEIGVCRRCKAVWEALPPMYVHDEVCAEPCDNCAFRPGSPEQADPVKWRALIEKLDPRNAPCEGFGSQFYCHKNVPIDLNAGPGNFLFPKREITADGHVVEIEDTRRMRTCSGFLRMVWVVQGKPKRPRYD